MQGLCRIVNIMCITITCMHMHMYVCIRRLCHMFVYAHRSHRHCKHTQLAFAYVHEIF